VTGAPAVRLAIDARAGLGECPRWSAREAALYWVDIAAHELHRFEPSTGARRVRRFDEPVGCFALRHRGGLVLALRHGFALLDDFDGELRPIGPGIEAGRADIRFNDGRADAAGRFWAGTVNLGKSAADAALYRLQPDGAAARMAQGALTSNGLAFSPDDRTLYWADTPNHVVFAFDFELKSGVIRNRRVFHRFPPGGGRPDGASVDEGGCYWVALYDGGRVARLSPEGRILQEVAVPARRVTMIGFGGLDRRTAYVTSARAGLTPAELADTPQAGGVFAFEVETPGLSECDFGG
jgi:sugar lactone lactonase YvrE